MPNPSKAHVRLELTPSDYRAVRRELELLAQVTLREQYEAAPASSPERAKINARRTQLQELLEAI